MRDAGAEARGGEGSVSDWLSPELAPDSTRLAARDNTSRGDSGSYAGSAVDITIPAWKQRMMRTAAQLIR